MKEPAHHSALQARAHAALAEGASFRGVRHATLALAPGESAFAARQALEDALRTADFQDAGRLIVVRQLRLRGLPAQAAGPQWARALERAWQAMAPQALPFNAPGAEDAPAVYFRSAHAARLAWLAAFAEGGQPEAWFWPRALPELAAAETAADALPPVLHALAAGAPSALAHALQALPAPALLRVARSLPTAPPNGWRANATTERPRAGAGSPAARATGPGEDRSRPPEPADGGEARLPAPGATAAPAAAPPSQAAMAAELGADDWRVQWLQGWLTPPETPAARGPAEGVRVSPPPTAPPAAAATAAGVPPTAAAPAGARPRAAPAAAPHPPPTPARTAAPAAPVPAAVLRAAAPRRIASPWQPWLADSIATRHGGLLMVLNALQALGYDTWWEAQPHAVQAAITPHLLAAVARRLRLPTDDPHQPLLALGPAAAAALAAAACRWDAAFWPQGLDTRGLQPASPSADDAVRCWQRVLGRALRRHAQLGLARLVLREGGLSLTPTHADVVLPLDSADARVRRAGLDRDPGWVPGLGRIVQFHYVAMNPEGPGDEPA